MKTMILLEKNSHIKEYKNLKIPIKYSNLKNPQVCIPIFKKSTHSE